MKKIYLISCCKRKLDYPAPAENLYCSPNFKKELEIAKRSKHDEIFVISAKHHLLSLDKIIEPYDVTLKNFSEEENEKWAEIVLGELGEKFDLKKDKFVILASKPYFKNLKPHLANVELPIEGLSTGKIGRKLNEMLSELD